MQLLGKYKTGGKMNRVKYFEKGGSTQQQQQNQAKAMMQALMDGNIEAAQMLVTAAQRDSQARQLRDQIVQGAQDGNAQFVKAAEAILQVEQSMRQGHAVSAKWGSKLGYIKSLKYAKGGKTCPACEKGEPVKVEEKACGGKAKKAKKRYFGGWL